MAKMPDPVKGKKSKSAVSNASAVRKAEEASRRSERGPAKPKYTKASTVQGSSEAAKRGAGAARNAMGGFGKTRTSQKSNRAAGVETGGVRKVVVTSRGGNTGGFGRTTGVNAEERRKRGVYRQGRAAGGFGETRGYVNAAKPENKNAFRNMAKRAANASRASKSRAASASASKQKSLAVGRAKGKASRMK